MAGRNQVKHLLRNQDQQKSTDMDAGKEGSPIYIKDDAVPPMFTQDQQKATDKDAGKECSTIYILEDDAVPPTRDQQKATDKDAGKEGSTIYIEDDAVIPLLTQGNHQTDIATEKKRESVGREGKAAQIDLSDDEFQYLFERLETDEIDLDLLLPIDTDMAGSSSGVPAQYMQEGENSESMLQKKINEQNKLIQQYELMLQKEREEKQHYEAMLQEERQNKKISIDRYNRELNLMHSVIEDYKKANKEVNIAFAKYRERAQLPEEPLYMPHPDGGGNVILVSEWKQLEKQRQEAEGMDGSAAQYSGK